jgi:maltose-binding protein MalE
MKMAIKRGIINRMTKKPFTTRNQPQAGHLLYWLLFFLGSLAVTIASCRGDGAPPVLPPVATATPSATPNQPHLDQSAPAVTNEQNRQLVLWVPEFFQPPDQSPAALLQTVYDQFRHNHPEVHLDIQIKAESGEASLYAYLRNAQSMAPTILPDVVLLDTAQLWQAAELGLIQPIQWDALHNTNDFFQFARTAASYQGQMIGIPYAADLIHLVYHTNQITQLPTTWDTLLTTGGPYWFAAGKYDYPNESLLLQYVGAGGQLFEDGTVSNPEALVALFTFLLEAKSAGVLPEKILEFKNTTDTWSTFAGQSTGFADASAHWVLAQQETVGDLGFAQIPTINGAAVTVARTWAFALVTPAPEQQQLALALIDQLLEPTVHSAWSRATRQLPTQIGVYTTWLDSSPYYEFLQRQLDVAIALPNGPQFADFARRLQQAQEAVLLSQLTVEDAVKFVQTAP